MRLVNKYSSKGINRHTTWIYGHENKFAGIDKDHDVLLDFGDTEPGAFNCFEIKNIDLYSHGEGIETQWYRTHEEAKKVIEDYLKGIISRIPTKKEPYEMTPEEYSKAIEWIKVNALPEDAVECHSYQGKEAMYYSRSTGRHYTVFDGIIRQSRTKDEIGFEPYKQEIHIDNHNRKE